MKIKKNKFLLLAIGLGIPAAITGLTISCGCKKEKANSTAYNFINPSNPHAFDVNTKTLNLIGQTTMTHIPNASFSFQTLSKIVAESKWDVARSKIEHIKLPDTIEYIGKGAFQKLPLKSINLETLKNLKQIDEGAFLETELENVTLPEGLLVIKPNAFDSTKILAITLPQSVFDCSIFFISNLDRSKKVEVTVKNADLKKKLIEELSKLPEEKKFITIK
ncbi:leucine rich repeat (LRR) protein [Metamycoplasma subdolum]|uniref:Leucine rich repeat (LRR) protein n=1 Tax=Metamycoplasma subdolum TaxID=92407 RepID=A0A3M0A1V6_9BACT|nr:leucine-rich repeat domain-containing protein [Metamycoplasma subdolum]RMA77409.1 leucine rich repeat (LRR) protein [Metamycoplasma subdolum]WPB50490.1 leucine-rich repeat domain-containing protein [Metamycoplasma subdolum]